MSVITSKKEKSTSVKGGRKRSFLTITTAVNCQIIATANSENTSSPL
jgi:hypothetical protein